MECVIDIEYNVKNGFCLIGIISNKGYVSVHGYINDENSKIIELSMNYVLKNFSDVYVYNLEYDFQFFLDWLFENTKIYMHYNTSGLSYVDIYYNKKRIIFKDLALHCGHRPVRELGKMLGMKKSNLDFSKMSMKNIQKTIDYNKIDCEIEFEIFKRLKKVYKRYGCKKVKASGGSNAFEIYKNNFATDYIFKISQLRLKEFRKAYKGGYCRAFKKGTFKGLFYLIDVNSMYPFIMLEKYPDPSSYKIVKKLKNKIHFYLTVTDKGTFTKYDTIKGKVKYYYEFMKYFYPFREFIENFMKEKIKAEKKGDKFDRMIFKNLMTNLYGKFAQLDTKEIITTLQSVKKYIEKGYNVEEISEGIFRVFYTSKFPFWTNFIWSIYTTAKARYYLKESIKKLKKKDFMIYYCDTDSIIIQGDINKIKDWLDPVKIGKWKIEEISKHLIIVGKKIYQMDNRIKCKGISKDKQREFIKKGITYYDRFVKIKEKIRKGYKAGKVVKQKKENRVN